MPDLLKLNILYKLLIANSQAVEWSVRGEEIMFVVCILLVGSRILLTLCLKL